MRTGRLGRAAKTAQYWLIAQAIFLVLRLLRRFPPARAMQFADRLARRIGPYTGRHTVALENLKAAFPEKSEAQIRDIASDMWGNMAQLLTEYVFLDQIFDFDPAGENNGRVEVRGEEIFRRLVEDGHPHIFFTAHLGNFELLPICAASYDLEITALFRPPNNPFVAKQVLSARHTRMGHLVPSKAGSALALARVLEQGGNVGVLVDQSFSKGTMTRFFDRKCRTNPLLSKLARQFDCRVHPARCIRLEGGRYQLELFEAVELPRTSDGTIDVVASTQRLNDIVEEWVREHPGQWTWFHKRWKNG